MSLSLSKPGSLTAISVNYLDPMNAFFLLLVLSTDVLALEPLPSFNYPVRTRGYSGYSTTIRGDISTLGMAGATVGLADSFVASGDNPAALAMTRDGIQLQVSGNEVQDGDLQTYSERMKTVNFGLALSHYPYNLSFGFWSPNSEGQNYILPSTGETFNAQVHTREYRATLSRVFFDNKLALGTSLIMGQAVESLTFPSRLGINRSAHAYRMGLGLGAMLQLPRRVLFGISAAMPMDYPISPQTETSIGVNDFFQPVKTPGRFGLGIGWLPNRFFKAGASVLFLGADQNVAVLMDDQREVGKHPTIQPRMGMSYLAAEFKEFKAEVSVGSYLEFTRILGKPHRAHFTAGLDLNIWIFNLGWGIDEAPRYQNLIYSAGIDVIRLIRKLDLIPPECRPPRVGFLPNPTHISDSGLARPLVKDYEQTCKNENLFETTRRLPERLEKKVSETTQDILDTGASVFETIIDLPGQISNGFSKQVEARDKKDAAEQKKPDAKPEDKELKKIKAPKKKRALKN